MQSLPVAALVQFSCKLHQRHTGLQDTLGVNMDGAAALCGLLRLCCHCRLLGVSEEASFEEIQDARNYLYEVNTAALAAHWGASNVAGWCLPSQHLRCLLAVVAMVGCRLQQVG